jgi:GNAT acetyltransferase-like protein
MRFYQLDPIQDERWANFTQWHPRASVFHSVAWLKALQNTYGYEPIAFTTSPPAGELKNGVVFCRVNSWITGHRLVSLPFSDHCEPLFDSLEDINFLLRYLQAAAERENWKYLEVRPLEVNFGEADNGIGLAPAVKYFFHEVDIRSALNEVFRSLDKDSVQRRVQRAQQIGLIEKCGNFGDLLKEFYCLLVMTRRRHHIPPPPFAWFRNLVHCQREALVVRVAYQDETPIAAILTLRFRDVVYYKYGCSDARFKHLGAMPWLLWNAIGAAKSDGASKFDMGRTEDSNAGLLAFKNHWVPHPRRLVYWRYPDSSSLFDSAYSWKMRIAKRIFSYMPGRVLTITGKLLYRHIG